MAMTKKDYEAIARAIKARRPIMNQGYYGLWCADVQTLECVAVDIADYCASQDRTFKRDRFLKACGVSE